MIGRGWIGEQNIGEVFLWDHIEGNGPEWTGVDAKAKDWAGREQIRTERRGGEIIGIERFLWDQGEFRGMDGSGCDWSVPDQNGNERLLRDHLEIKGMGRNRSEQSWTERRRYHRNREALWGHPDRTGSHGR